jgi:pyruvate,water dikinase|tara:strand:- start:853 stop:1821 length:969 start_codon:yes stop_codon:yes gene_type:complete
MALIDLFSSEVNSSVAGKKGENLRLLENNGILVPKGFVVSPDEFHSYSQQCRGEIQSQLRNGDTANAYQNILKIIQDGKDANCLEERLGGMIDQETKGKYFVARSSGSGSYHGKIIEEDSEQTALAGQFDSYLMIPEDRLFDGIKLCWASLFNPRSQKVFDAKNNPTYIDSSMSVVVQEMILADKSFVMMTEDPLEDESTLGIESTYGPCETLVSGKDTGDLFLYRRQTKTVERELSNKLYRAVYAPFTSAGENCKYEELPARLSSMSSLTDKEIGNIVEKGLEIEKIFGRPQDVEGVIADAQIYITQTRNITTQKVKGGIN